MQIKKLCLTERHERTHAASVAAKTGQAQLPPSLETRAGRTPEMRMAASIIVSASVSTSTSRASGTLQLSFCRSDVLGLLCCLFATAAWPHTRLRVLRVAIAGELRIQAAGHTREWLQWGACGSFASASSRTPVSLLPTTAAGMHPCLAQLGCTNLPHCPFPADLQSSLKEVLENIEQTRTVWHMQVGLPLLSWLQLRKAGTRGILCLQASCCGAYSAGIAGTATVTNQRRQQVALLAHALPRHNPRSWTTSATACCASIC